MTTEIQKPKTESNLRELIMQMKNQFALALPKHITPDRFMRVALTAINKTPKLLQCTKESVLACLMDCSQFGLEPDGRNAHLIPYGNQCTLLIDYKGLVALARRSGEISDIHADIVREADKFEYSFGTEGKLIHRPALENRGKVIAAYSFVKLKDNSVSYEVMSIDEINAIKERSKAKTSGPWITDYNEMAKKTVFRRHSKWLPLSSEFQEAIERDLDTPIDIAGAVDKTPIEMPKPKKIETVGIPVEVPPIETTVKTMKDANPAFIGATQIKALDSILNKYDLQEKCFAFVSGEYQVNSFNELSVSEFEKVMAWVGENTPKKK